MRFDGIHHITAITGDAPRNVDFYTRVLGLRLTAKSVNQDDPGVYHLFFGDEVGSPGADLTFFEYPGAIPGRPGAGMAHRVVWRVGSPEALDFWAERLAAEGVAVAREEGSVRFSDPEHLDHELVVNATADAPLTAEHPEIPAEHRLQGFEGVRVYSHRPESTAEVLELLLGASRLPDGAFELRGAKRGGCIHHVAVGTTEAEYGAWLDRLNEVGMPNSGPVDRHYFRSLYFREPGGLLFEIATEEPGFTVDGPVEELGRNVILPPWLEPQRAAIEARLTPLPDPRENWPDPVHKA